VEGDAQAGDVLSVLDHDGRFIGRGLYNPRSQIAVRLLTRHDEAIDLTFFRKRFSTAKALRARLGLPSERTNAYRLINSEGDGLPGLVVDIYGDAAVVQLSTLGLALRRATLFDAIEAELGSRSLYEVAVTGYAELEGFAVASRIVRGESRPSVSCQEDGLLFEVEPLSGQKTGLFLDQREVRKRVGALAKGRGCSTSTRTSVVSVCRRPAAAPPASPAWIAPPRRWPASKLMRLAMALRYRQWKRMPFAFSRRPRHARGTS